MAWDACRFIWEVAFRYELVIGVENAFLPLARRGVRLARWSGGGLIGPAILIEPGRRIAPRPIVGLVDVALKPGHDGLEGSALER